MKMPLTRLALALATAPLTLGTALAQHAGDSSEPQTITLDAQSGDYPEWLQNPHVARRESRGRDRPSESHSPGDGRDRGERFWSARQL